MSERTATLCNSADQELEQLLDEIAGRLQAGEQLDDEQYAALHPEYADRLRQLLPAMRALAVFGRAEASTCDGAKGDWSASHVGGVLGDFRIIRELGRGGMGVVYEAEQLSIGRHVAVKVLPFASMLDERRLSRFRNEVRAAGQLHHSNIVPVYAVGCERGVHFYAMQLVAGHSLAEIIAIINAEQSATKKDSRTARPSSDAATCDTVNAALSTLRSSGGAAMFRTIARLAVQAAEALEHAHASGVIHRDIKPSNLLLDERGSLWLTDFGLASVESGADLTMSGDLLGTLRYMSPEQTLGSRVLVDHRTDIYSLGATLYELAALKPAFQADDRGELLRQIAVREPKAPRRFNPAIPADLETIILKAMSKDVAGRYHTAQAMADDLRRFLENKPIQARRPSLRQRGRKWVGRHAALTSVAVAALFLVATFGAAAAIVTHRSYIAESKARDAAEANLQVAAQVIERLLSRASDERYFRGDLDHAESLAADAAAFYDDLLKRSDDPELRFRAAKAHGAAAHIWQLIGRHEKAALANRRAEQLLERLTTAFPGEPQYLAALAANFNRKGLVDWSLDRPIAAEPSFRQAWEIWTELAERFPNEPTYQSGVAGMLANLGSVCYFSDRFPEAEEYYRRSEAIKVHLPAALRNTAVGLASQAGSCTNRAELARLRGQYDQAIALLHESIPLHQQSLEKWPTNPVALDCYYHTLWNIGECQLGAGRPIEAATAVETLIEKFPKRMQAYHDGAVQLLRGAELADQEKKATTEKPTIKSEGEASADPSSSPTGAADAYRQRAHELITLADEAPERTPDAADRFAWFLLTCEDESFRDAPHALALAKSVVKEIPERGGAWFTLAVAEYRSGDWAAAEAADQNSIKFSHGGKANIYDWILLSMLRIQQGRADEAHRFARMMRQWTATNQPKDPALLVLSAEARDLMSRRSANAVNQTPHFNQ